MVLLKAEDEKQFLHLIVKCARCPTSCCGISAYLRPRQRGKRIYPL